MRLALAALVIATALAALAPVASGTAHAEGVPMAQNRDPIGSFFRSLFGGLTRQAPSRQLPQQQSNQPPAGEHPGSAASQPRAPKIVSVQKDPDAKRVVVFGDFFASGLQSGLDDAFIESSAVRIEGQSNPSSGLVRRDHFDWPAAIRAWLNDPEKSIDVAVVLIGGNDRQALRDSSGEHAPRSERWRELYVERVDEVMKLFVDRKIPLYWVSLPPVASAQLSQDYGYFNDIYRERAYRYGVEFIDIWNSFVDENGRYTAVGPDVNGEQRQLRAEDGLHLTGPGNRKLAHFVARAIRRDFGRDGGLFLALPQGQAGPQPFLPGDELLRTGIGDVVPLNGLQGTGVSLAGGSEPSPKPPEESAYYRVLVVGDIPQARPGGAGDFTWREGRRQPALVAPQAAPSNDFELTPYDYFPGRAAPPVAVERASDAGGVLSTGGG
ncbi:hypothetical protein EDC22_101130 [Tepidamorphus gemmatus]|uniref:SGNH hydrolase-type esterase domain-containing protein n=1 Tax=Tepidamorphus gemmatus TaxID=747076 RepID=A0A4V6NZS5_9HYPH|nr:SGNH family hydrolase [Tepidamorphus gemmatus]TCT13269.1 hypothetical protein EDC22_101130 [Tepidamorphus gemmatus]